MTITRKSAQRDAGGTRVRLRVSLFDALCEKRGATTDEARGELLGGYPRETVNRYRHHRQQPSGLLMLEWANRLKVRVEDLWEVTDA